MHKTKEGKNKPKDKFRSRKDYHKTKIQKISQLELLRNDDRIPEHLLKKDLNKSQDINQQDGRNGKSKSGKN